MGEGEQTLQSRDGVFREEKGSFIGVIIAILVVRRYLNTWLPLVLVSFFICLYFIGFYWGWLEMDRHESIYLKETSDKTKKFFLWIFANRAKKTCIIYIYIFA